MALNMEKIAVTPYFRTYWIQHNITEMQSYGSAISDLYREGATYREERVILPKKQADEAALAQSAQAVTGLLSGAQETMAFTRLAPRTRRAAWPCWSRKFSRHGLAQPARSNSLRKSSSRADKPAQERTWKRESMWSRRRTPAWILLKTCDRRWKRPARRP